MGTFVVHALFVALFLAVSALPEPEAEAIQIALSRAQVTPLVLPRELTLSDLMQSPQETSAPKPSPTRPAAPTPMPAPAPRAAPAPAELVVPEPPPIEIASAQAPLPPGLPFETPQPQIQPVEQPKLAFEAPQAQGIPNGGAPGAGGLPVPRKRTVEEMAQEMARQPGGGVAVGDLGAGSGGLGDLLSGSAAPNQVLAPELMSDPQGVDFRPYLAHILSTVRRNWTAVIPESARLGRQGRVRIQFAIDQRGGVPKLVIAQTSGAEALDRAAVAGISASTPFPPLPREFTGDQVRLQFTFLYNVQR